MCKLPDSCSVASGSMAGAASGPAFGRRLVFFGAAEDVSEPTLLQLFSRHGDVTGLFLVRSALGLPSGCGYVTMATAEQAAAALAVLQSSSECAEGGGKLGLLIVQLPHQAQQDCQQPQSPQLAQQMQPPQQQQQEEPATGAPVKDVRTAFFTKVPPTVTAHQLIQLFTCCGDVVHVELFTPWPGAKISKGCGLVEFSQPEAAVAAVHSLHQAFTWPHSHSPLVVEWLDAKRQAANRASKLSRQGSGDSSGYMRRAAAAAAAEPGAAAFASPSSHLARLQGQLGTQQQQQQQHTIRCCPLPRLQPQQLPSGWVQQGCSPGTGGAQQGAACVQASMMPQVQQLQPHMVACYTYQQQQQQQGDPSVNGGYWWPLHNAGGAASCYDSSGLLRMAVGSTVSSTASTSSSLVAPISNADLSTGSMTCCSQSSTATGTPGAALLTQQQAYAGSGCQSPLGMGEPPLVLSGASGGVMLLQPTLDDAQGQAMYVLSKRSNMGHTTNAAAPGPYTSVPVSAGGLALQQQQQQQQYQQLAGGQTSSALYAAAARAAAGQTAKQQAAAGMDNHMMMVPLSARQLAVMPAVLPEVPRLTGAQAYLGANIGGRGAHLVLAGQAGAVGAAHCAAAMLLSSMGIDDPLLPAGLQR